MIERDVSAVICVYTEDRWPQILEAIQSVQAQTHPPRELIVAVDHNATLLGRLRERFPEVLVIASNGPKGKSGALNTAVESASGSIIALLDDDAAAEPNWLEELYQSYSDPRVLGVGGHLEPRWSKPRPRWFPEEFLWVFGCTFRGMPMSRLAVRSLIGANMSFRKEVFVKAGGSRLGLGPDGTQLTGAARAEDTEFCLRASAMWPDRLWIHEPRARVRHHVPPSRANWSYFKSRCYVEGVSKAAIAKFAGRASLRTERRYVARTLTTGVLMAIADGVRKRDVAAFARAGAIVAGFTITTSGYLRESARLRRAGALQIHSADAAGNGLSS
jgi:glycosyltransferase involved in cell wall biosynthesis